MRILRLDLLRYGPFTDRVLNFRSDAKLHLVFGPNEAGKSSSLAAIGDLLFGFSKRREQDFLHEASVLRVGAELVARNGEPLGFRRRRGNKNTLLANDAGEETLHEDVLAPFIGNLTREVFSRAFGLNSDTLRQGGEAMLESEGEMGAVLFAAASGLTGLSRVRHALEEEADAIFAPRASKERRFYQALERYNTAIAAERQQELKSGDWRQLIGEIGEIERQLAEVKARRAEVTVGLARLQRLKALEPLIAAIDHIERDLAAFDDLPEVPPDFVAECRAALDSAEGTGAQERLAEEEVVVARTALDVIDVDEPFIVHAEAITELFSRKADYLSKLAEVPRLEEERDALTTSLAGLTRRLGLADADEAMRRLPPESVMQTARHIIDEGLALERQVAADEQRLEDERAAIEAQQSEGTQGSLNDPKPWRDQLSAVGPDLKELNEQAYLENTRRGIEQRLAEAAQRLTPPVPEIERLERATLPTREMILIYKESFERLLNEQREARAELDANSRQHAEAIQRLAEQERQGPLSHQDAVRRLRESRDRSFGVLRGHMLREGRLLTAEQLSERLLLFEEEMAEADRTADEAVADAARISQIAGFHESIAALDRHQPEIQARLDALAEEQARTIEGYNQLFVPLAINPLGPDAMLAWLTGAEEVLAARQELATVEDKINAVDRLGKKVGATLRKLAQGMGLPVIEDLPPLALARLMEGALNDMQDRWSSRLTREGARQAGLARLDQLEDSLAKARRHYAEWRTRFIRILPLIGLDANVTAEAAATALGVWQEVPDIGKERAARAARLTALRRDTGTFSQSVQHLARELMPVLTDLPPHGLIDVLRERTETARAARARQDDARVRLEVAEARLGAARGAREAAATALRRLSALLPAGADPRREIARLTRRDALRAQLDERRKEFEQRAEGIGEAAIRAELPGFDRARAPLDVEDLEREAETLHTENNRLYARLGQYQSRREALEAGTGAELAAFERAGAEADILAAGRQWAVRKIAAVMLNAAIEKHRESQSDPLMLRAAAFFSMLTSGSFSGLVQDYGEDDQPRLLGVRKSGERVAMAGMSEGTRDQLYLALRLAYLEDYAGRTEPVPFIGDDIFQTFDDERTHAGVQALASAAGLFQPILFTHHLSVVAIARRALGDELDYIEL